MELDILDLLRLEGSRAEFATALLLQSFVRIKVPTGPLFDLCRANLAFFALDEASKRLLRSPAQDHSCYPSRYSGYLPIAHPPKETLFLSHPDAGPWGRFPALEAAGPETVARLEPILAAARDASAYLESVGTILLWAFEEGCRALARSTGGDGAARAAAGAGDAPYFAGLIALEGKEKGPGVSDKDRRVRPRLSLTDGGLAAVKREAGLPGPSPSSDLPAWIAECRAAAAAARAAGGDASTLAPLLSRGAARRVQSVLGMIRYSEMPREGRATGDAGYGGGDHPADLHTDYGLLSLIPESSAPGLQVLDHSDCNLNDAFPTSAASPGDQPPLWAAAADPAAAPAPSTTSLLAFAGEMLDALTGGAVIPCSHQVTAAYERERRSNILFLFPRDAARMETPRNLQVILRRARGVIQVRRREAEQEAAGSSESGRLGGRTARPPPSPDAILSFPAEVGRAAPTAAEWARAEKTKKVSVNNIGDSRQRLEGLGRGGRGMGPQPLPFSSGDGGVDLTYDIDGDA